jgi:hypothetical protein
MANLERELQQPTKHSQNPLIVQNLPLLRFKLRNTIKMGQVPTQHEIDYRTTRFKFRIHNETSPAADRLAVAVVIVFCRRIDGQAGRLLDVGTGM